MPGLALIPPPLIALANSEENIPPLDTNNVFIVAYYNAGQEINLTKAASLIGLAIDKWGGTYFDATYIFHDPKNVPVSQPEAYQNSTVYMHVRVRSDGWILAWINKTQPLSDIVMSGIKNRWRRNQRSMGKIWHNNIIIHDIQDTRTSRYS